MEDTRAKGVVGLEYLGCDNNQSTPLFYKYLVNFRCFRQLIEDADFLY